MGHHEDITHHCIIFNHCVQIHLLLGLHLHGLGPSSQPLPHTDDVIDIFPPIQPDAYDNLQHLVY
jgi:hypothetical protein